MSGRLLNAAIIAGMLLAALATRPAVADTADDLAALNASNGAARALAADRLAARGDEAAVVQAVTALASDAAKPGRARVEAVRILGRYGQEGAIMPLSKIMNDPAAGPVRVAAVMALAKIDSLQSRNQIAGAAMNPDPMVKAAGIMAAAESQSVQALPALLLAIKAHAENTPLACMALDAASTIIAGRKPQEDAIADLRAQMKALAAAEGGPTDLKTRAALALGTIRDPEGSGHLLGIITANEWTRAAEAAIADAKKQRGNNNGGNGNGGDRDDDGLQDPPAAQPDAQPAQPDAQPAQPDAQPAQPDPQPAQPDAQPAQPADIPDTPEEAEMRRVAQARDGAVAMEAARILGGYGAGIYPEVMVALLLDNPSQLATDAFAHYCSRAGAAIRPRLIATLVEDNAHAASVARTTLVELLASRPADIAQLGPVESLEPAKVAALATALEQVQCVEAVDLLLPCVDERPEGSVSAALAHVRNSVEVRRAVMGLFAAMSIVEDSMLETGHGYRRELHIQRIIPPAVRLLGDPDDAVRRHCIQVLENRAAASQHRDAAREAVLARLTAETNQALLGRLAQLVADLSGADAVGPVVDLLPKVDDAEARVQLMRTLTRLPPSPQYGAQVLEAVSKDLTNADNKIELREAAAEVLRWVGSTAAVNRLKEVAARPDVDFELKKTLLDQFRLLGTRARTAFGTIKAILDDTHAALQGLEETDANKPQLQKLSSLMTRAIDALAATKQKEVAASLIPLLQFHKGSVSLRAVSALRDIANGDEVAAQALKPLLEALQAGHPKESEQSDYRSRVLDALSRLPYASPANSRWKADVGRVVQRMRLLETTDEEIARQAVNLMGKIEYYPLRNEMTAAYRQWAGNDAIRQKITSAMRFDKTWKAPAD